MSGKSDYGKGDRARPFDRKKWDDGWDRVFAGHDLPPGLEDSLIERRRDLLARIDKELNAVIFGRSKKGNK